MPVLPAELVEHILVFTAADSFPHAIASFSQTCKANYDLVYKPADQHLWREIFLTTFDDPRASGGGPGWGECTSALTQSHDDYDWGAEFRRRVWASDYIRRRTNPIVNNNAEEQYACEMEEVTPNNTRAFDVLLSVINTALPCPPTIVFSFLPPSSPGDSPPSRMPRVQPNAYPTFPPLPQAIGGFSNSIVTVGPTDASGRTLGDGLRARNPAWLYDTLKNGLPAEVTRLLSGDKWTGGLCDQFLSEAQSHEMQAAGHIITCTGFAPVPQPSPNTTPSSPPAENADRASSPSSVKLSTPSSSTYMSVENQLKRARRLARMRVYNLRYLAKDRHWGPFLPFIGKKTGASQAHDDELIQPILALFRATPHPHDHAHDPAHAFNEADGDGDTLSADGDDDVHNDDLEGGSESSDQDQDEDEDAQDAEDADSVGPPSSGQLRADWTYLAAVRMVVEANLRDSVPAADLRGLFSLDGLRPGSAPWDASVYKRPGEASPTGSESGKSKGKGKETEGRGNEDEIEGWDWAGVNGVWKRCVCWMDYRDLILHNYAIQLSGEFEDPHLHEAVRIVTMRLRVKSYSPSKVPKYSHLPTIHVEGETTGNSVGPRRMHGTVSVIADGSVRWTLYSTVEASSTEDEWVSESVQVGGVASAMGLLGMWTGADHERMDPLGPTWAWKVG